MIDLDDVSTFPDCIREWVTDKRDFFLRVIPVGSYNFDYEIIHKLQNLRIDEMSEFKEIYSLYQDTDFTGWHITRVENIDNYCKQGILTVGWEINKGIERLNYYFNKVIKIEKIIYDKIVDEAKFLWNRDNGRKNNVCFFFTKAQTINDVQAMMFAANLGGEILNWSLNAVDSDLYRTEPYKRLWIWGTPCRVKFKAKLKEMYEDTASRLIREIMFYYVMKDIYGFDYIPSDTGEKQGDVIPENILKIEHIENYEKIMSQCPEFHDFYN